MLESQRVNKKRQKTHTQTTERETGTYQHDQFGRHDF